MHAHKQPDLTLGKLLESSIAFGMDSITQAGYFWGFFGGFGPVGMHRSKSHRTHLITNSFVEPLPKNKSNLFYVYIDCILLNLVFIVIPGKSRDVQFLHSDRLVS